MNSLDVKTILLDAKKKYFKNEVCILVNALFAFFCSKEWDKYKLFLSIKNKWEF